MVKILVIEDENPIREEVMDWLQFEGYEVFGAANGRLGLEAALRECPDLIISDIRMPEMDGFAVLLEVRSSPSLSQTSFVMLTASADRESFRRGMELGADDYLTKPFTHGEVLNAVRTRLEKREKQLEVVQSQIETLNEALNEEREKRLLKSRLVAMFSHDFRNPLAAILSSASLLRDYEDRMDTEGKRTKLNRIIGSVRQLIQMMDEMMLIAQMESGHLKCKPEVFNVTQLIENIINEFRSSQPETHNLKLDTSGATGERLTNDPGLLRQILTNLVSNAVKYSPTGSEVNITAAVNNGILEISVQDSGIGIPEQDLPRLFQPFERASNVKGQKGTGLGLTIVKEASVACGGNAEVTSIVGKGSTFRVWLPNQSA